MTTFPAVNVLLPKAPGFSVVSFPYCLKNACSWSSLAHLLAINSFSVCSSENVFISPSSLKGSFTAYGTHSWQSFFLTLEKYCAPSFWLPRFQVRSALAFVWMLLSRWCLISLLLLSRICVFDFQKFHCVLSWTSLSLSFFAFNSPSWIWKFCVFHQICFQSLFLRMFFLPHSLLSSGTPMIQMLNLLLPSNRSEAAFSSLFSFCWGWINYVALSSGWLFTLMSTYYLTHPLRTCCIFLSCFPLSSFYRFYPFAEIFYFFHLFQEAL